MSSDNDNEEGPIPYHEYTRAIVQKGILAGILPSVTTYPHLLEAQARKVMKERGFEKGFTYIIGAAGENATVHANRQAFREWKIIPRVLKPTTPRDLSVTIFGHKYGSYFHYSFLSLQLEVLTDFYISDVPVFMAPIGIHAWFHEDKEIGTISACEALRVPYCLSTASATSMEELCKASPDTNKWFQLYWPTDEEITASLLTRAKANGFKALVVTLDTWTLGWRPADLDNAAVPFVMGEGDENGFQDPVFRKKFAERSEGETPEGDPIQAGLYWTSEIHPGDSRSWEDLKILRKYWDGPIVLKGVLAVEDARLAVEHGMDGIIVSTHGGRQLDGTVGALEVLPEIVDAVGSQITVMMDSGIRTGTDIFKALALGAKAVFVGRPVVYGLGIAGKDGAEAVLAGLLAELDLSMGFSGVKSVADLNRTCLRRATSSIEPNL